jgi:hypothetical protein
VWVNLDGLSWNLANLAAVPDPSSDTIKIYDPATTDPNELPAPSLGPPPPGFDLLDVPKTSTHMFDPSHVLDYSDASLINNLHEAPLLYLLLRRYAEDHIYTACSDVLISVNPYKRIEGIYGDDVAREVYDVGKDLAAKRERTQETVPVRRPPPSPPHPPLLPPLPPPRANPVCAQDHRPPHVFVVADRAYGTMCNGASTRSTALNQSVIISGESGAGKTEAAKQVSPPRERSERKKELAAGAAREQRASSGSAQATAFVCASGAGGSSRRAAAAAPKLPPSFVRAERAGAAGEQRQRRPSYRLRLCEWSGREQRASSGSGTQATSFVCARSARAKKS